MTNLPLFPSSPLEFLKPPTSFSTSFSTLGTGTRRVEKIVGTELVLAAKGVDRVRTGSELGNFLARKTEGSTGRREVSPCGLIGVEMSVPRGARVGRHYPLISSYTRSRSEGKRTNLLMPYRSPFLDVFPRPERLVTTMTSKATKMIISSVLEGGHHLLLVMIKRGGGDEGLVALMACLRERGRRSRREDHRSGRRRGRKWNSSSHHLNPRRALSSNPH